jgi:hypothetical protein
MWPTSADFSASNAPATRLVLKGPGSQGSPAGARESAGPAGYNRIATGLGRRQKGILVVAAVVVGVVLALMICALGFAVHFLWVGGAVFMLVWVAGVVPWERTSDQTADVAVPPAPSAVEQGQIG